MTHKAYGDINPNLEDNIKLVEAIVKKQLNSLVGMKPQKKALPIKCDS